MAVYYKFKSARDYDSVPMDGPFISVGALKEKIFESKHLGRGTDFDLVITNAQTDEGWFLPFSCGLFNIRFEKYCLRSILSRISVLLVGF